MVIFLNKKMKMKRETSFHKNPHDDPNIIGISLPQPQIRVKFPKLLMKSMQRRNHRGSNESNVDQREVSKNGDFLRRRIGFTILNACGSKKAQEMSSSGNQPVEMDNADDSNLKNIQDSSREEKVQGENPGEVDKKTVKMPTKISRFIRKRIGFPFRKLKLDEKSNGAAIQKNCLKNLDEIQSGKREPEKVYKCDGEEGSEMELCKKRILMGEKCRPLNLSGALHYDTDGVLLPEEVL